jgi:preprotein translocase subunit SecY
VDNPADQAQYSQYNGRSGARTMVSAAEQLAANLWFTLGALFVYLLGTYTPLPGIDPAAWEQMLTNTGIMFE